MFKPIITRAPGLPIEDNKMPFHIQMDNAHIQPMLHRVYMTDECATLLQQYIDAVHPYEKDGKVPYDRNPDNWVD